jgi:hypothetical protein
MPATKRPAPKKASKVTSSPDRLTLRDLNRATLGRQMLLAREAVSISTALERLVGLQAQWPAPPYTGLWTRLKKFERRDLAQLIEQRRVVRAPLMRATLHVANADDYLQLRPLLRELFAHALDGMPAERTKDIDPEALGDEARPFLAETPRTQEEVRQFLAARHPKLDVRMMGHAVRMNLPLVQTPGEGTWGFSSAPAFALAETWLGRPLAKHPDPRALIRRYLAAFGPATVRDAQTWCGLRNLQATFDALRPELRVLADEKGRELFDLPDAQRPSADTAAPARFLPEFDNLLLSHVDRSRVVPEAFRKKVFLPGLRVAPTFLIDGFVAGSWNLERTKNQAVLALMPFAPLPKKDRTALAAEAEQLARFLAPDTDRREIKFGPLK